jgi:hypothetical protein
MAIFHKRTLAKFGYRLDAKVEKVGEFCYTLEHARNLAIVSI